MRTPTSSDTVRTLVQTGQLTQADADEATRLAAERHQSVLEVLLEQGWVDRSTVVRTAALSAGLDYVELSDFIVDMAAVTCCRPSSPAVPAYCRSPSTTASSSSR